MDKDIITIMDFSGIYKQESFYNNNLVRWINCRNIIGTNGYCSIDSKKEICEKINKFSAKGIHFIDSGNYHYISEFWVNKIRKKFNLIVFDHHTDMQKPMFANFISCGSWILDLISNNQYLNKVILLGISKEQEKTIDEKYKHKIICYDEDEILKSDFLDILYNVQEDYPVYISIDKDVLDDSIVKTTWNQGKLNFERLRGILHIILTKADVIGIDVCGECRYAINNLLEIRSNNRFNKVLLEFLEKELYRR